MRFCVIHLTGIAQRTPRLLFCIMNFKILLLELLPYFPGANELIKEANDVISPLPHHQLHQPRLWFITGGYLVKR